MTGLAGRHEMNLIATVEHHEIRQARARVGALTPDASSDQNDHDHRQSGDSRRTRHQPD